MHYRLFTSSWAESDYTLNDQCEDWSKDLLAEWANQRLSQPGDRVIVLDSDDVCVYGAEIKGE